MLIKIKNLKLQTFLGVYEWEKTHNRDVIINAEIMLDCDKSLKSDSLSDTIDYDILVNKIRELILHNRFRLIEKMAGEIMKKIMEDSRIAKCKLEVDKVGVVEGVESFSVVIESDKN